jgi:polyhydroxyalkanoate synthase
MASESGQANRPDPVEVARAVAAIAERSQKLVADFVARQSDEQTRASPDPFNVGTAFVEMTARLLADPTRFVQAQISLWGDYMRLWQQTTERLVMGAPPVPLVAPASGDRRFKDPAWQENAIFDFIKQSYLLTSGFLQQQVREVEGLDPKDARKVDFYTRQFVDAMAPSNFVLTNPEVLRATVDSGGENLLRGLEHLLDDLERGQGKLAIKMTDTERFQVGVDIAATPGKVVYQNALMQLIQYTPTTERVLKRPLLIVPPWINKFYILDLTPEKSFVRWAVSQGHTVFVISWVNPDASLADKSFEDYLIEGPLRALDAIEQATGERQVNALGYCIGGTLLATTLAAMAARGDERIASATYLTTLVDFADCGELGVFIDDEQLQMLEARMAETGILPGSDMSTTFNMLRANDLIWSFVINNYLLGKEPFPFDLLFWNADTTAMPRAMHSYYLRNMYQQNRLVVPGALTMAGVPIDLDKITLPSFILATKEDHIAPWAGCYAARRYYGGKTVFCLSGSGHVAGAINPPAARKYGYWHSPSDTAVAEEWLSGARYEEGSWWPAWQRWVSGQSKKTVPARTPGAGTLPVLEDAPGSYVKRRQP